MSDLATSRRAVTRAHVTLPAIDSTAWDQAMKRLEVATAASDKFDAEIFHPLWQEYERRCGDRPNLSFTVSARDGSSATYRMFPDQLDEWAESDLWSRYARPIRDAWNEYEAREAQAEADLNFEAMNEEHDRLVRVFCDIKHEILKMPAPHFMALRWKLEHTIEPGEKGEIVPWSDDEIRLAIVADYQRLLPVIGSGIDQSQVPLNARAEVRSALAIGE